MKPNEDYMNDGDFLCFMEDFKKEELKSFEEYQARHKTNLIPVYATDKQIWECYLECKKKKKC